MGLILRSECLHPCEQAEVPTLQQLGNGSLRRRASLDERERHEKPMPLVRVVDREREVWQIALRLDEHRGPALVERASQQAPARDREAQSFDAEPSVSCLHQGGLW